MIWIGLAAGLAIGGVIGFFIGRAQSAQAQAAVSAQAEKQAIDGAEQQKEAIDKTALEAKQAIASGADPTTVIDKLERLK